MAISNPTKVLFPTAGYTKLDLARYYLTVAEGALRAAGHRPNVLVRYPNGVGGEFFYQKRAPESRPDWIEVVALKFPSGRTAEEVVPRDAAALVWLANLGCLELHPHPVRADNRWATLAPKPCGAFRPVPTAVPPSGSSASRGSTAVSR